MRKLLLMSVLVGCGSGSGGGNGGSSQPEKIPYTMLLATADDRPACEDGNKDQLVYVESDAKFYACRDKEWKEITIKGEKGDPGTNGPDNKITDSILCVGTLPSTSISVAYRAAKFTSGDLFATASVATPSWEVSSTFYYAAKQNGADDGTVLLVYDMEGTDNGGYWELSFNSEAKTVTAVYNDSEVSGGSRSWTIASTDCTVASYE